MSLNELKKRIKKNEGYSQSPYKDQLGFYTIGYGHLIKKNELKLFNKKYNKKYYKNLFEKDFRKSLNEYKKLFNRKKHNKKDQELLIEMLYQNANIHLNLNNNQLLKIVFSSKNL